VRRPQRVQAASNCALRRRRGQFAGITLPLRHPLSIGQRTGAVQRRRAGGAEAQHAMTRWHQSPGDVALGVHAALGCTGSMHTRACLLTVR
jgi:hypothetical protein